MDAGAVLVRRVDEAVGDAEADRVVAHAFQVAAPPVAVELLAAGNRAFDPFNKDKPAGRVREHSVAGQLGGAAPVVGGAGAPSCLAVGLVLEVGANHIWRVGVTS